MGWIHIVRLLGKCTNLGTRRHIYFPFKGPVKREEVWIKANIHKRAFSFSRLFFSSAKKFFEAKHCFSKWKVPWWPALVISGWWFYTALHRRLTHPTDQLHLWKHNNHPVPSCLEPEKSFFPGIFRVCAAVVRAGPKPHFNKETTCWLHNPSKNEQHYDDQMKEAAIMTLCHFFTCMLS